MAETVEVTEVAIVIHKPKRPTLFRKMVLGMASVELVGILACLIAPCWMIVSFTKDKKYSAGLFFMCNIDEDGALTECSRDHDYFDRGWYIVCDVIYTMAAVASAISVVFGILSVKIRAKMSKYSSVVLFLHVISLGKQLATLGMFGDAANNNMCPFRILDKEPRVLCFKTPDEMGDEEMYTILGWTFWLAVAIAFITISNMFLGYVVLNEDVFYIKAEERGDPMD